MPRQTPCCELMPLTTRTNRPDSRIGIETAQSVRSQEALLQQPYARSPTSRRDNPICRFVDLTSQTRRKSGLGCATGCLRGWRLSSRRSRSLRAVAVRKSLPTVFRPPCVHRARCRWAILSGPSRFRAAFPAIEPRRELPPEARVPDETTIQLLKSPASSTRNRVPTTKLDFPARDQQSAFPQRQSVATTVLDRRTNFSKTPTQWCWWIPARLDR